MEEVELINDVGVSLIDCLASDDMVECSYPDCRNGRGGTMDICVSHRRQTLRGEKLRPLRTKPGRVVNGTKPCKWCGRTLPVGDFNTVVGQSHNVYRPVCKGCEKEYYKYTAIWRKYKLSKEQYDRFIKGGCMVCEETIGLHIDHDHKCCLSEYTCGKCIRGVLCGRCNLTIGKLEDSPELLRKMRDYIVKYRS